MAERIMTDWDLALDTMVSILRTLGQHCIDTETLDAVAQRALYERWARHLLFLQAPPGHSEHEPIPQQRDWFGVRRFAEQQQDQQHAQINQTLAEYRSALSVCADSMAQLMLDGKESDALAQAQLESLEEALNRGSAEQIRFAVTNTVSTVQLLLEERQARLNAQVQFLAQQVKLLAAEVDRRDRPAEQDPLTRLETRRSFEDKLALTSSLKRMTQEAFTLVMVEIDDFSQLRNLIGDATADAVIKRVSRSVAQIFPRRSDVLARYEGNEFAILLKDATLEDGRRLGERLLEDIRRLTVELDGRKLALSASVGVSELRDEENAHRAMARADGARYRARLQGGDCVMVG